MRANQTFILSLIFLALVGTFVVALIIKFSGPQEVIREVSTTSSEPEFIAVLNKVENEIQNTSEIALSTLPEHSHEEEEEIDVVKIPRTARTLPDNYIVTMELYRNRVRLAKGEDYRKLTARDFREGYGLYKIPPKSEIKRILARAIDKN